MATLFYDINWGSLIYYLLPVRLRNTKQIRWLGTLLNPVYDTYVQFYQDRTNNLYELAHNSQVVYLQGILNEIFDGGTGGINIVDGAIADPLYVFLDAETEPLWLGLTGEVGSTLYPDPQWLFTDAETSVTGYQFIVMVPVYLTFDINRMKAVIDKYRLPSKSNYGIITY